MLYVILYLICVFYFIFYYILLLYYIYLIIFRYFILFLYHFYWRVLYFVCFVCFVFAFVFCSTHLPANPRPHANFEILNRNIQKRGPTAMGMGCIQRRIKNAIRRWVLISEGCQKSVAYGLQTSSLEFWSQCRY